MLGNKIMKKKEEKLTECETAEKVVNRKSTVTAKDYNSVIRAVTAVDEQIKVKWRQRIC